MVAAATEYDRDESQLVLSGENSMYRVPAWSVLTATVTEPNADTSTPVPVNVALAFSVAVDEFPGNADP